MRSPSLILLFVLAPVLSAVAWGQAGPVETGSLPMRVGLETGIALYMQSGEFLMHEGRHRFHDGNGTGYAAELVFDSPLSGGEHRFIVFEGAVGYRRMMIEPRHVMQDTLGLHLQSERGTDTIPVAVFFEDVARVDFAYLTLSPSIKVYPFQWLHAGLGVDAAILVSARRDFTQNIVTRAVEVKGYGLADITFPGSPDRYSRTISEEDLHDASDLLLNGRIYLGAEFEVGDGLWIGPRALYSFPFTRALEGSSLKIHALQFTAGLRYAL